VIVVVGSGIAGLTAALSAARRGHRVTLVTKQDLGESNTRYAQGGVATVLPDLGGPAEDTVAAHVADTSAAGAGLNDAEAVRVLCAEGPERVRELLAYGTPFDRLADDNLARGLEAAHSHARILHAGGDATGAAIAQALVRAARAADMTILEHAFLVDLVTDRAPGRGMRAVGVDLAFADGTCRRIEADAVILATGGAGQLYEHTTNPAVATGDGLAAAWRAGAVITDAEFYQFHPTSLAVPGNFLISEAVRGEGAVLLDASGARFMTAVHPDAELAPRDVVARGIADAMRIHEGAPVRLDATALGGAEFLARRFPSIDAACRARGLDWSREPIPVTPAAHYWMGGVRTDVWARTSLPGLYAVGEVACTGVHGANRLASNSLLEGLVYADRAVRAIDAPPSDWPRFTASLRVEDSAPPVVAPFERADLQRQMWDRAGLVRDRGGLQVADKQLRSWRADRTTIAGREDENLRQAGLCVLAAAQARNESRGAHYRSDRPASVERFAHHIHLERAC